MNIRKTLGTAMIIPILLFCATAVLTPSETSNAYTHTIFAEDGTATW